MQSTSPSSRPFTIDDLLRVRHPRGIVPLHVQSPPEARPDAYVRNSPLFHLDKVRAPVLIITGAAHWDDPNQARQAFSALRRLGKRVELRIYRDEGHLIFREPNVRDVSKRMLDWFDEHLRGREPDARR